MPQVTPEAAMAFDHLGVVVKDLGKARAGLTSLLGIRQWSKSFDDPVNGVRLQFGRDAAGMCYELLEPLGADSPIAGALRTRSAILNHVAYRVADLAQGADAMRCGGAAPTGDPKPAIAYGGRNIQFFVTPFNFIVELIHAPGHAHDFLPVSPA